MPTRWLGAATGQIEPLWPGLPEAELLALDVRIADPNGRDVSTML